MVLLMLILCCRIAAVTAVIDVTAVAVCVMLLLLLVLLLWLLQWLLPLYDYVLALPRSAKVHISLCCCCCSYCAWHNGWIPGLTHDLRLLMLLAVCVDTKHIQ